MINILFVVVFPIDLIMLYIIKRISGVCFTLRGNVLLGDVNAGILRAFCWNLVIGKIWFDGERVDNKMKKNSN